MSRYRDNKGRFIAPKISEKLEKKTTKNPPPPPPLILIHQKFVQEKFSEERAQRQQLQQQQKALDLKPLFRLNTQDIKKGRKHWRPHPEEKLESKQR
jgi:hypothetical protein